LGLTWQTLTDYRKEHSTAFVNTTTFVRRTDSIVKGGIQLPHNRVHPADGMVRKDQAAPEFAAEMSHELRTPLNVIIGLCQYLERNEETPLTEKQHESVVRMERNAHALLDSVTRLLEIVRSGKYD
jgi:signal transduction histidine kinase